MPTSTGAVRAFQYGLIIFALTALIGLANATKIFGDISRDTLLTHLHSGTLGWITMGIIGVAIWIFDGEEDTLPRNVAVSAVCTAAYVLAFWSGNFIARAIFGSIELLVIIYWWWWVVRRALAHGYNRLDVPRLSVTLGMTTLIIGSTLGVLMQILFATSGGIPQNVDLVGAHAFAQVAGYLVLVAAGVAEWRLTGGGSRSVAGQAQVWLLFLAGIVLVVGSLSGIPTLQLPATILQVIALVIIAVRFGVRAMALGWGSVDGARHAAIALPFLVVGIALEIMLIFAFISSEGDFTKVPSGLIPAVSHAIFIGVTTNVLFACVLALGAGRERFWPWADHVIFWGLNIGAASFIAALLVSGSAQGTGMFAHPVAFTAPIMGLSALLAIVTFSMRLQSAAEMAPAAAPA
ncbi:MAG TPA: hypothetical protein VF998_04275 [Candidatus Limnocylindria bacterium]